MPVSYVNMWISALGINYLSFRLWVHVWTAFVLFLCVVWDASSLVSYITRFTEESFATLIAIIFIYEALVKLYKISDSLDIIEYYRGSGLPASAPGCVCLSTGATNADVAKLVHKFHWDNIVPVAGNSTTPFDYSIVELGKCRHLGGQLQGDSCFVLYDKFLMSLVLMVGTFFLATSFKVIIHIACTSGRCIFRR